MCKFETGQIEHWKRGAEALYGWTSSEALGNIMQELLRTLRRDARELRAELLDFGHWEDELEHMSKDGKRLIVASRWALRRDDDAEPKDILVLSGDITERKQAKRELSRLAAAKAALQQRDQLLATVSHDLKTPLTAATGRWSHSPGSAIRPQALNIQRVIASCAALSEPGLI